MKKRFFNIRTILVALCCAVALMLSSCGFGSKNLHGEELLKLSDGELFETVYFQNLDLVESFPSEKTALSKMSAARKTVYILSIYDMEIQNGGLCQFFVNSSRLLAPYVQECLETAGAQEHQNLFSTFVSKNNIDLNNLDSFEINDLNEYEVQTKRYDFDAFDQSYCELKPLQDYLVSYIKANISEF